jgi:hypothetical protein
MLESIKTYYYYSINDSKKEPIDKVLATDKSVALSYFAKRKKISKEVFKTLYNIDIYVPIKPK